VLTDFH